MAGGDIPPRYASFHTRNLYSEAHAPTVGVRGRGTTTTPMAKLGMLLIGRASPMRKMTGKDRVSDGIICEHVLPSKVVVDLVLVCQDGLFESTASR